MQKFNSIRELALFTLSSTENEWIYTNIDKWNSRPKECAFWVIQESEVDALPDDEVYESAGGPFLPKELKNENLWPWMTQDVLAGVLLNLKVIDVDSCDDAFLIKGINYYREFDDFLEL